MDRATVTCLASLTTQAYNYSPPATLQLSSRLKRPSPESLAARGTTSFGKSTKQFYAHLVCIMSLLTSASLIFPSLCLLSSPCSVIVFLFYHRPPCSVIVLLFYHRPPCSVIVLHPCHRHPALSSSSCFITVPLLCHRLRPLSYRLPAQSSSVYSVTVFVLCHIGLLLCHRTPVLSSSSVLSSASRRDFFKNPKRPSPSSVRAGQSLNLPLSSYSASFPAVYTCSIGASVYFLV